jgi:hypothetical protein
MTDNRKVEIEKKKSQLKFHYLNDIHTGEGTSDSPRLPENSQAGERFQSLFDCEPLRRREPGEAFPTLLNREGTSSKEQTPHIQSEEGSATKAGPFSERKHGPGNLMSQQSGAEIHDCAVEKLAMHCFWKDPTLEKLLNNDSLHPYVRKYQKQHEESRMLIVFLTKEFNCTVSDGIYSEAVEKDIGLDIVFVSVDGQYNNMNSKWPFVSADEKLFCFYMYHLLRKTPACVLLVGDAIGYIGPAVGNPEFVALPATQCFVKFSIPNWQSPMLAHKADFSFLFGSDRLEYLRNSQAVDPSTEVLIVHMWGVWCKASQKYFDAYERLRSRLPLATHMILHFDAHKGPFTTDTVLAYLPHMHPDFLQAKDVNGLFYNYFKECEYTASPATFIYVNSKLAYVGEQHITCNLNFFPELIRSAQEDPRFAAD